MPRSVWPQDLAQLFSQEHCSLFPVRSDSPASSPSSLSILLVSHILKEHDKLCLQLTSCTHILGC